MPSIHGEPRSGDHFTDRRRTGIGGSDAGAILGLSSYASALSVWEEKRGLAPPFPVSERMVWGSRLERAILDGYAEDTGRRIRKGGRQMLRHPELPFVIGHPDALAEDRLVEVKTTARLDERWGPDGSADVPPHVYAQVQHYMVLTGKRLADVAALEGGRQLHLYTVPEDLDWQAALIEAERDFWQLVETGQPPPPDGSDSARETLRRLYPRGIPEEIVAGLLQNEQAETYLTARAQEKHAHEIAEGAAQQLQSFMGERERLLGTGWSASWRAPDQGRMRWQEAAAAFRDQLIPYMTDTELDAIQDRFRGEASRTFRLDRKRARDD